MAWIRSGCGVLGRAQYGGVVMSAVPLTPEHVSDALSDRALRCALLGQVREAREHATAALRMVRTGATAHVALALVHWHQADFEDAARQLDLAIRSTVDGEDQSAVRPVEVLTGRELVVLSYLPTLRTVPEIAAELHVSVNTVKTQLKSIYRKLSVASRRSAVECARRLGLL
jgi:DNA-binding NarL/FixJ family response regulator